MGDVARRDFQKTVFVKITSLTFFWGTHRPQDSVLQLNEVYGRYIVANGDGAYSTRLGILTPMVPDFTNDGATGAAPHTVTFTNTSTGNVDQFEWDFGDGADMVYTTDLRDVVHTYTGGGTYTVALKAIGAEGEVTETKTDLITVS